MKYVLPQPQGLREADCQKCPEPSKSEQFSFYVIASRLRRGNLFLSTIALLIRYGQRFPRSPHSLGMASKMLALQGFCLTAQLSHYRTYVRLRVRVAFVAVPEKIFGLTLFLDFFDRGHSFLLAVSATGGARKRPVFRTF